MSRPRRRRHRDERNGIPRRLIHWRGDVGGVVNILVRQIKGDDLAIAGVNASVRLEPGAALCRPLLFNGAS